MEEVINLTEKESDTYDSEMVRKFTWCEDPKDGSRGLLFVQFVNGSDYVYYDVPKDVYESLSKLSDQVMPKLMEQTNKSTEEDFPTTVGEYLHEFVISVYDREDVDYNRIDEVLDERS